MKELLITGAAGFIGSNVLKLLKKKDFAITALIRPGSKKKMAQSNISIAEIDLAEPETLKNWLVDKKFDYIFHLGALRGGRKFSKHIYTMANIYSTEQLALHALKTKANFVFCSSVGVFGAIPLELPANNYTLRNADNHYHFTKIQAEKIIQNLVVKGLNAVIIRPSITYGVGDYGFPYTLTRLINHKLFCHPQKTVKIHLASIESVAAAFAKCTDIFPKTGSEYIIADANPVKLEELVDFISEKLHATTYPRSRRISESFFRIGETVARKLKNELWQSRFELISKSWYYDVAPVYEDLSLKKSHTIPDFSLVTDWYLRK